MLLFKKAFTPSNPIRYVTTLCDEAKIPMFPIEIFNEQDVLEIDEKIITSICSKIIFDHGFQTGRLGIVLVDNDTIHILNRRFLAHDYPTDVVSFELECADEHIEGELVVSTDMARERCQEYHWSPENELFLYLIHGTLHLVGYNDQTPEDAAEMHRMETYYLSVLGIETP